MDILECIRSRRSVRSFTDQELTYDEIMEFVPQQASTASLGDL